VKDPAELTLTKAAAAIRRRKLSSTELTRWMFGADRALATRAQRIRPHREGRSFGRSQGPPIRALGA